MLFSYSQGKQVHAQDHCLTYLFLGLDQSLSYAKVDSLCVIFISMKTEYIQQEKDLVYTSLLNFNQSFRTNHLVPQPPILGVFTVLLQQPKPVEKGRQHLSVILAPRTSLPNRFLSQLEEATNRGLGVDGTSPHFLF